MKKFIAVIMVLVCVLAGASASAAVTYENVVDIFLTVKDYDSTSLKYEDYYGESDSFTDFVNYFHDDYDVYIGIINNDESANVQLIGQSADWFTHYVNFDTSAQDGIVNIYSVFTALADNIKEDETQAVFFFADLYTTNTLCFFCSSWTEADVEAYNDAHEESPLAVTKDVAILKMNYAFAKN